MLAFVLLFTIGVVGAYLLTRQLGVSDAKARTALTCFATLITLFIFFAVRAAVNPTTEEGEQFCLIVAIGFAALLVGVAVNILLWEVTSGMLTAIAVEALDHAAGEAGNLSFLNPHALGRWVSSTQLIRVYEEGTRMLAAQERLYRAEASVSNAQQQREVSIAKEQFYARLSPEVRGLLATRLHAAVEVEKRSAHAEQENATLRQSLAQTGAQVEALSISVQEYAKSAVEWERYAVALQQENAQLRQIVTHPQAHQHQLGIAAHNVSELESYAAALEDDNATLREEAEAMEHRLAKMKQKKAALKRALSEAEAELDELKHALGMKSKLKRTHHAA
jgi:hypothetical protein